VNLANVRFGDFSSKWSTKFFDECIVDLALTECVLVAEYVVNEGTQETGTA
jgi:hypothetical protein